MMGKENRAVLLIAILIFILVCLFTNVCKADANDAYYTTMISFFAKRIDSLETSLAETREALAEMRGEMRGRQNVTTGVSAGVPTGLAGVLVWWLRRERKRKG